MRLKICLMSNFVGEDYFWALRRLSVDNVIPR